MEYNLSLRVKELCTQKGILQKDLAIKMGIAPESLSRTLKNNPQLSTLVNIASALEVEISELFNKSSTTLQAIIIYEDKAYTANDINSLRRIVDTIAKQQ